MEYLLLGYVIGPFSLDGTVKIFSRTNLGHIRYKPGNKVYLVDSEGNRTLHKVVRYRNQGQIDYIRFEDINCVEEAEAIKSFSVEVEKNPKDLEEGYYFFSDLVGCEVYDQEKKKRGVVVEVREYPAQVTLYVRRSSTSNFQVPFVKQFIKKVDIEKKEIDVEFIDGML